MPEALNHDSREELKRLQAREDYIQLRHKRSVDALWKRYVEQNRTNPESRDRIPTLNRNQIYKWSKEDEWERHAKERIQMDVEEGQKLIAEQRGEAYRRLALLTDTAVDTLLKLCAGGDKVALQAATEILDRVGVVKPEKRAPASEATPETKSPDPNATDDEIRKWFAERIQNQGVKV